MTARRRAVALAASTAALALHAPALAHVELTSPVPRSPGAKKTPPCGGDTRGAPTLVARAGALVTVRWIETIDHPGWHEISFSTGGDGDFRVLRGRIPDRRMTSTRPLAYSARVRLPRTATPTPSAKRVVGTLRVIQYMTDRDPPTLYYSCADVRLLPKARRSSSRSPSSRGQTREARYVSALRRPRRRTVS